jgi:LysR family transcriptional activator of glutamate synthase operon
MAREQLRYFVAVAERLHVTRAAEELHVSQPALSRAIRRLEQELDAELFLRDGGSLRLTDGGHTFLVHARRALAELDAGRRGLAESLSSEHGTVRLAFLHTLGAWLVPRLIVGYREVRPNVTYQLEQNGAGPMERALREGSIDLALTSPRPDDADLGFHALMTEPLLIAVPPAHRLAGRRRVSLADMREDPFVVVRHGYGLRVTTDELCARAGFAPRISFEGEDVETLRGLVAAGLGVALLPRPRSEALPSPHLRLSDRGAERTIGVAWHARRPLLPVAEGFRDFVVRQGPQLAADAG